MRGRLLHNAGRAVCAFGWLAKVLAFDIFVRDRPDIVGNIGALAVAAIGLVIWRATLLKGMPCRHPSGRHATAQPSLLERITFRQAMWSGCGTGFIIFAISTVNTHDFDGLQNLGAALFLGCLCALILHWGFRRTEERQQRRASVELLAEPFRQQLDEMERKVGGMQRAVYAAALYAAQSDGEDAPEATTPDPERAAQRRRHLRVLRSDDRTGPQRAVLCAALRPAALATVVPPPRLRHSDQRFLQPVVQVRVVPDLLKQRAVETAGLVAVRLGLLGHPPGLPAGQDELR